MTAFPAGCWESFFIKNGLWYECVIGEWAEWIIMLIITMNYFIHDVSNRERQRNSTWHVFFLWLTGRSIACCMHSCDSWHPRAVIWVSGSPTTGLSHYLPNLWPLTARVWPAREEGYPYDLFPAYLYFLAQMTHIQGCTTGVTDQDVSPRLRKGLNWIFK